MRILLIAPKNNYHEPMPRINIFGQGLPYLAGSLKAAGHQVFGLNMSYQWCGLSPKKKLEEMLIKAISDYQPDIIGVGGMSADYNFIRDTINLTRKYTTSPIVLGGGIVTYDREWIFENLHPDYALCGESETQIMNLISTYPFSCYIPNLSYWLKGKAVYNLIEYQYPDLDTLPYPDYDIFNYRTMMQQFTQTDIFYGYVKNKPRVMPLTVARSCPFSCTFCLGQSKRPKYRSRSVDSVIKEIEYFYNKYEFNLLFLYDELFSARGEHIKDFCQKIIELKEKNKIDFVWTCDLRVENIDNIPLKEMRESGCAFIGYGFESASQRILNSMNKKITVGDIGKAIKVTNDAGIGIQGNFIFGDPKETVDTMKETIDFYNKNCTDLMISLGHIVPYPSSPDFDYCLEHGIIKDKRQYYENSNRLVYSARYNMTAMPDNVWFPLIYSIEERLNMDIKPPKQAQVVNCEVTGEYSDEMLPLTMRRQVHKITVNCPHCHRDITYHTPLGKERIVIKTACMFCNKYFMFYPPQVTLLAWRKFEAKVLGLLPIKLRVAIVNYYWSFRHWLTYMRNKESWEDE